MVNASVNLVSREHFAKLLSATAYKNLALKESVVQMLHLNPLIVVRVLLVTSAMGENAMV